VSALRRRQVRGHVPSGPPPKPSPWWTPTQDATALLLHAFADNRDKLTLATSRELLITKAGLLTIGERLFAPAERLAELHGACGGLQPDVRRGLDVFPIRIDAVDELGKLITRRSYRSRWPVVGWDLPWSVGRLTAHCGPARGHRDGFSLALHGTGIYVADRWAPSWDHPRLTITAQGGGGGGAFYRWMAPKDRGARYRGDVPADFLDLQVLASALAGSDLDESAQACHWFSVPWPSTHTDPVAQLRAEAGALSQLYAALLDALVQVAPGLAPRDVYSFGSIATHILRTAGVVSPLRKAEHDPYP
jgi:hypothetical protein